MLVSNGTTSKALTSPSYDDCDDHADDDAEDDADDDSGDP